MLEALLCLYSCRTYNDAIGNYYGAIAEGHFEAFRVAFPKYVEQPLYYAGASIQRDSTPQVQMEKVEDVNRLAFSTLQERFMKELGLVLTRLVIKKLAEQQIKKENASLPTIHYSSLQKS